MLKSLQFLLDGRQQVALTWKLLKDARVPKWKKVIPFLPLIYILSPVNLMTFAIPFIGPLEDVAILMMAMKLFERTVDNAVLANYKSLAAA